MQILFGDDNPYLPKISNHVVIELRSVYVSDLNTNGKNYIQLRGKISGRYYREQVMTMLQQYIGKRISLFDSFIEYFLENAIFCHFEEQAQEAEKWWLFIFEVDSITRRNHEYFREAKASSRVSDMEELVQDLDGKTENIKEVVSDLEGVVDEAKNTLHTLENLEVKSKISKILDVLENSNVLQTKQNDPCNGTVYGVWVKTSDPQWFKSQTDIKLVKDRWMLYQIAANQHLANAVGQRLCNINSMYRCVEYKVEPYEYIS